MTNNFTHARFKLTMQYLLIVGGVIILFSLLIIYQANDSFSDPAVPTDEEIKISVSEAKNIAETLYPNKEIIGTEYEIERGVLYFTMAFADESEVKVNLLTGTIAPPRVEDNVLASFVDDFEEKVGWIALIVFMLASFLCTFIVQRNLSPIAENIRLHKQFVSDVAHELRNPLAALHARIESVVRTNVANEKSEVLTDLLAETKHLIVMSESLLAFEKNEKKAKQIAPQSVAHCVDSVLRRLEQLQKGKQITVQTNIDSKELMIDRGDLETILYNLLHNAFKFTLPSGVITIVWANHMLSISDTGIGIAKEDIVHIFDRFYKADSSRTEEGNGLGLSLVKEISERYNAKIKVSSTLGKGSLITIQFK